MRKIVELSNLAEKIMDLTTEQARGGIWLARAKYTDFVSSGSTLKLVARNRENWERNPSDEEKEVAKIANEALQHEYRRRGAIARTKALIDLANELEALRAILPQIAAAAAIEAGHIARALIKEANDDDETV